MIPRIYRQCAFFPGWHDYHIWERLNPQTMEPFRRGRAIFICKGSRS